MAWNPLNIPLQPGNVYDPNALPKNLTPIAGYTGTIDTTGTCGVTMFAQIRTARDYVIDKTNHTMMNTPVIPDQPFRPEETCYIPSGYA